MLYCAGCRLVILFSFRDFVFQVKCDYENRLHDFKDYCLCPCSASPLLFLRNKELYLWAFEGNVFSKYCLLTFQKFWLIQIQLRMISCSSSPDFRLPHSAVRSSLHSTPAHHCLAPVLWDVQSKTKTWIAASLWPPTLLGASEVECFWSL